MKKYLTIFLLLITWMSNAQGKLDTLYYDIDTCLVTNPLFAVRMRVLYIPDNIYELKRYKDYNLTTGRIIQEGGYSKIDYIGNRTKINYEGKTILYGENGNILLEQTFRNGKPNGKVIAYDSSGQIIVEMSLKYGLLHGECKEYNNGVLVRKDTYVDDKLHGYSTIYYSNGAKHIVAYYENDELNGPITEFYMSGAVMRTGSNKNGVAHGDFATYDEAGRIIDMKTAVNGQWTKKRRRR